MNGKTNIQVSREVRDRLKMIGKKGESYNDIVNSLLNNYDIQIKWTEFQNLNITEQKKVVKKIHEYNHDYMFVPEGKGYYSLMTAYFDDEEVRNVLNQSMKELMEE